MVLLRIIRMFVRRVLVSTGFALCILFLDILPINGQELMDASPAAELKRLRSDLLKDYNKMERPVKNQLLPMNVRIFFDVRHIVALDEKYQTLTVRGQLMMKWTDEFLTWDPSSYSGLTNVRFTPTEIWIPDIHSIYNTKAVDIFKKEDSPAIVYSNGTIGWYPPAVFDVPCSANYRHYPFDSHVCSILFGAWTHMGDAITLEMLNISSSLRPEGTEWHLRSSNHKNELLKPFPSLTYPMVRVDLDLERVSRIYRYICVMPTLSTILSSLLGFWLLPKETSRYLIGLSNVILTSLLLQYLAVTVPAGKQIPLLAQYSAACLCMSGIFVLVTVVNHLLGERSGPVPQTILRLSHSLPVNKYLCLFACDGSALAAPSVGEESQLGSWPRVSLVLDRVSFYVFSCVYVVLLAVLASI